MDPVTVAFITLVCAFGGALAGVWGRRIVPDTHLDADSKDIVKLSIGLIATMTALILGLVVASAKSSFDASDAAVKNGAAATLALDRLLDRYGPETKEIRELLKRGVARRLDSIWPQESKTNDQPVRLDDPKMLRALEDLEDRIARLKPRDDAQRALQSRALASTGEMLKARWLVIAGAGPAVPMQFLVALIFWVTLIFGAFGLMSPRNATVIAVLFMSALSVALSIFMVLEMEHPFDGYIKVSSAPLRYLLLHLGQ
jgi:hypothetical protein